VSTGPKESRTKESLQSAVTWLVASFLLAYVGVEVALGGWIVTFMLDERAGEAFASGMVATGFWLGLTVGRVVLGFVTGRIGEKLAVAVYLALSVALQLLFWLVPSFIASAIFAAFLGFFLGPLFPAAIMVATKLLPRRLHVSAIGFVAAFGSSGAAVFPFAVGAIAQARGVWVLQPFALALIAVIFVVWIALPGGLRKKGLEEAHGRMLEKERARGSLTPNTEEAV
jgi:fucose permease